MKKMIMTVMAVMAFSVIAAEKEGKTSEADQEAARLAAKEKMLTKTGGMVDRKGKGKIVFVNCQSRIPAEKVADRVQYIRDILKYTCELRTGEWKFNQPNPTDANVTIYIVDDAALPLSVVATESHWGVCNTATLEGGNRRFEKEMTRVLTLTAGGGMSQVTTAPMRPASTAADLDKLIADGFTFDMFNAILKTMESIGVTQNVKTTYRKACKEGWAAAPTNDYQKAIWNEVHELPSNPIKIKFDPKRDK